MTVLITKINLQVQFYGKSILKTVPYAKQACLSFPEPLGDVDFYPAGGSHQPGCTELCTRRGCTENDFLELLGGGCSHGRSKDYFIESINGLDKRFTATLCGSYGDFRAGLCHGREEAEMGLMLDTERWVEIGLAGAVLMSSIPIFFHT